MWSAAKWDCLNWNRNKIRELLEIIIYRIPTWISSRACLSLSLWDDKLASVNGQPVCLGLITGLSWGGEGGPATKANPWVASFEPSQSKLP